MPITAQQCDVVVTELKRIGPLLHLSNEQMQKLQEFMSEASEKVQEYKKTNPNASVEQMIKRIAENRENLRQRLVNFLTPEQLTI